MSIAGQFIDNSMKILAKPVAIAAMLLSPFMAKSQTRDPVIVDTAKNIVVRYDEKSNQTVVTRNDKVIDHFRMSKHYKKTIDNPDRYTALEALDMIGRVSSHTDKAAGMRTVAFFAHPSNAVSVGYNVNSSSSPYYDGPSVSYKVEVGLGKPYTARNLSLLVEADTYTKDPRKISGAVVYKNRDQIGFAGYTNIPNRLKLGLAAGTGPQSPFIGKAEVGGELPLATGNNLLNLASPYARGTVGVRLFPKSIIGLEFTASATALKPNNRGFISEYNYGPNAKSIITQTSIGAALTIRLGNAMKDKDHNHRRL